MPVHGVVVLALPGMAALDLTIPLRIFAPRPETP